MSRGGYRAGAGRPKGSKDKNPRKTRKDLKSKKKSEKAPIPIDVKTDAKLLDLTPLDYMLKIMRDKTEDNDRRDKMAALAAQYIHPRPGVGKGKKEEREERAKMAGAGRFGIGKAPLKRVK